MLIIYKLFNEYSLSASSVDVRRRAVCERYLTLIAAPRNRGLDSVST